MAKTFSSSVTIQLGWLNVNTVVAGVSSPTDQGGLKNVLAFTNGSGQNQVNGHYYARFILDAATTYDVDLRGVLTDFVGATINLTGLRYIVVFNLGLADTLTASPTITASNPIYVGGAGSGGNACATPFAGDQDAKMTVHSGGHLSWSAPVDTVAVTAGTGDILRIENPGASKIMVDLVIGGIQ